jgi:hypothetical protein
VDGLSPGSGIAATSTVTAETPSVTTQYVCLKTVSIVTRNVLPTMAPPEF